MENAQMKFQRWHEGTGHDLSIAKIVGRERIDEPHAEPARDKFGDHRAILRFDHHSPHNLSTLKDLIDDMPTGRIAGERNERLAREILGRQALLSLECMP